MNNQISLLKNIRSLTLKAIAPLSDEQLTHIPEGFNNHILWNFGHMMVVQQLLTYQLTGQPLKIDDSLVALFRNGSSPKDWQTTPDIKSLKEQFVSLPEQFELDYEAGKFTNHNHKEYQTSTGPLLKTIEDALSFNAFHEGIHLGAILALKKFI